MIQKNTVSMLTSVAALREEQLILVRHLDAL